MLNSETINRKSVMPNVVKSYSEDMIKTQVSNITEVARTFKNGEPKAIRKFAEVVSNRLALEPFRLCGNDEYMHREDITEILAISAISEDMSHQFKGDLKKKLREISRKALHVVFDNIPLREVKEANMVLDIFFDYLTKYKAA